MIAWAQRPRTPLGSSRSRANIAHHIFPSFPDRELKSAARVSRAASGSIAWLLKCWTRCTVRMPTGQPALDVAAGGVVRVVRHDEIKSSGTIAERIACLRCLTAHGKGGSSCLSNTSTARMTTSIFTCSQYWPTDKPADDHFVPHRAVLEQFSRLSVASTSLMNPPDDRTQLLAIAICLPIFDRNQGNIAIKDATREQLRQERASAASS